MHGLFHVERLHEDYIKCRMDRIRWDGKRFRRKFVESLGKTRSKMDFLCTIRMSGTMFGVACEIGRDERVHPQKNNLSVWRRPNKCIFNTNE